MTKRLKDSLILAFEILGGVATILTITGVSVSTVLPMKEYPTIVRIIAYIGIVAAVYVVVMGIIYLIKGRIYKNSITLKIGKNTVTIMTGDIFSTPGWRVIAVDTMFSTVIDDVIISKSSLHGQLVEKHGDAGSINDAVKKTAGEMGIEPDKNGSYHFTLGTVIPYKSSKPKENEQVYLMAAMTELNEAYEAHTTMAQFEHTLMWMWKEISKVYAGNDIVLPLLGSGITRFDDDQDDPRELLRCMLCTLNTSRVHLKSKITVVIYDDGQMKIPLYEYKNLFRITR